MPTAPTATTPMPSAPDPDNRSTFDALAYPWANAQETLRTELDALASNVYGNAVEAQADAVATAGDRVQTGLDKIATAADTVATAADRVQTGLDVAAAAASAASAAAIAGAFVGTSTTSWTPTVGSQAFTTQTGEQYTPGVFLTVVSAATPSAWGFGMVTGYTGSTLTVDIQVINGTGAHIDWNISLSGARGAAGSTGLPGADGAESLPTADAAGTVDAITATFSPAITLTDKQKCCVISGGANASTTPTFAPNGLTPHTITMHGGQPLAAGSIGAAGFVAMFEYNLANTRWELMNPVTQQSNGGATETSSAVDITLTSASTRLQAITMTAAGKSVAAPDATTLTEGGALFVVKNTGSITFAVRDSAGGCLAVIGAGKVAALYLTNNSTAAGAWAVGNKSTLSFLDDVFAGSALTVNAATTIRISVTAMSATQAIVTYRGTSNYLECCTLNVVGTTITNGAVLTVNAVASNYTAVTSMSATQAIVAYQGTSNYLECCTLNVSGTTITNGAVLAVNIASSTAISITAMSTTQAIVTYRRGTSTYLDCCTLNVSGTTITNGTILTVNAVATDFTAVTAMSATQAIVAYCGTSAYLQCCTLNVSGTTITNGAVFTVNAVSTSQISVAAMSATQAIVTYCGTSAYLQCCTLNINGTALKSGTVLTVNSEVVASTSVTAMSATQAIVTYQKNSVGLECCTLYIKGTTVTNGEIVAVNAEPYGYAAVTAMSVPQSVVAYQGTSGYLQCCTLEVTV